MLRNEIPPDGIYDGVWRFGADGDGRAMFLVSRRDYSSRAGMTIYRQSRYAAWRRGRSCNIGKPHAKLRFISIA